MSNINNYCMFENHSAEIVLEEIEQCDYCAGSKMVRPSPKAYVFLVNAGYASTDQGLLTGLSFRFFYSYAARITTVQQEDGRFEAYLLFRIYGNMNANFTINQFQNLLLEYINIWVDRTDVENDPFWDNNIGRQLLLCFQDDVKRQIFWNFIFEGASNQQLGDLTKVEIYQYSGKSKVTNRSLLDVDFLYPGDFFDSEGNNTISIELIAAEDRCSNPQKTGAIKSLKVINGGSGYAFEIEERVSPSGITQVIDNGIINVDTIPKELKRRRETYQLETVNITHNGQGYKVDDIIPILFNDSDFRRSGIVYNSEPSVKITEVDENGKITNYVIENSGEFYKYVGTNEHRAFPVSIVVNNYWDHPYNNTQSLGQFAKLRPVVGVDPSDSDTYGKIKRVEVEYGGIDYVIPETYWTIETQTGQQNPITGDIESGLDIQHLVDPCKFNIIGSGLSSSGVMDYALWLQYEDGRLRNSSEIVFPDKFGIFHTDPSLTPFNNEFANSVKYYYRTGSDKNNQDQIIKWTDRVQSWNTVIQSGSCPFVSGGLLDRTYQMALVEEPLLTKPAIPNDGLHNLPPWHFSIADIIEAQQNGQSIEIPYKPITGNCSTSFCNSTIQAVSPLEQFNNTVYSVVDLIFSSNFYTNPYPALNYFFGSNNLYNILNIPIVDLMNIDFGSLSSLLYSNQTRSPILSCNDLQQLSLIIKTKLNEYNNLVINSQPTAPISFPDLDSLLRPFYNMYIDCNPLNPCNVYTMYDAHRYPIAHVSYDNFGKLFDWHATPRPYMEGCMNTVPIAGSNKNYYCNVDNVQGYTNIGIASNSNDKCSNAEYSMYAEFAKILVPAPTGPPYPVNIMRAKSITYKMKDPITMTIRSNDLNFVQNQLPCEDPPIE
jgi:hypothetical protein